MASLSPSPRRFKARTVNIMARPGKRHIQPEERIYDLPSESMAPHSGVGGVIPTPRKLREEAEMMLDPTLSVVCTIIGLRQLGMICLRIIFQVGSPMAYPDSTYSISLTVIIEALAILAKPAKEPRAMAIRRLAILVPNKDTTTTANMMYGME